MRTKALQEKTSGPNVSTDHAAGDSTPHERHSSSPALLPGGAVSELLEKMLAILEQVLDQGPLLRGQDVPNVLQDEKEKPWNAGDC